VLARAGARSSSSWPATRSSAFGWSIPLCRDSLLIGAQQHGGPGAAYVFLRQGSTWSEQAKLVADDAADGYRDPTGPCSSGFNLSNGYEIRW